MKSDVKEELCEVDIDKIIMNPYQPRRLFNPAEIEELSQSIKAVGLIHPPLVRSMPGSHCYELISGERRYRAARLAGMKTIPVIVCHTSYSLSAQAALIENVQRVDLNPLEIAKAMRNMMDEFGFNQDEMAQRIGKKRSTVANYLRLLGLPPHIQEGVSTGKISMGHAKAILGLDGIEKQNFLYKLILKDELNVREAESYAIRLGEKTKKPSATETHNIYLDELAEKIQQKMGTKVTIQGRGKTGRISIDYYDLDDLDRLLALLGIQI